MNESITEVVAFDVRMAEELEHQRASAINIRIAANFAIITRASEGLPTVRAVP